MENKFRIRISSMNSESINIYSIFLSTICKKLNIDHSVVHMPKRIKRIALLKSPHVHKKAFEHFQMISYKTLFCLKSPVTFTQLKFLITNKPKSVTIQIAQNK
jgi:ribosomal protein S10